MKKITAIIIVLYGSLLAAQAQNNMGIGTNTPDASAVLDVTATGKGLLIPRMTESSRTGIASPATGLMVYQTTAPAGIYFNAGTPGTPSWVLLAVNGSAVGGDLTGNLPNPSIAANAVNSAKIADNSIVNADINASAGIVYSKLSLNNSIVGNDLAAGPFVTSNVMFTLGNNNNVAGELRLREPSGSGTNYTGIKAQAQTADLTYTLPANGPTAVNQVLQVQAVAGGSATLAWGTIGGGSIAFTRVGVVGNAGNTSYNLPATGVDIVGVDMSAGTNFTVNLPSANVAGRIVIIKIEQYNNGLLPVLTIDGNGAEPVDSAPTLSFGNANGVRRLYSDGAGRWFTW